MEKFQIAKYGMMQVTAIVYAVLMCGTAVKLNKPYVDQGFPMSPSYYHALFIRDYGIWLMAVVLLWSVLVSVLSSSWRNWDEDILSNSGIILAIVFAVVGTYLAIAAGSSILNLHAP